MLKPGTPAPEFSLTASNGRLVRNSDYLGKQSLVVFFYPKDHTLGCTIESCAFRDAYQDFVAAGAEVVGISADSVTSHVGFQQRHSLPFVLASDPDGSAAQAYGVERGPFGLAGRATFVIDRHGMVRDVYSSHLRVKRHVARALDLVRRLAGESD